MPKRIVQSVVGLFILATTLSAADQTATRRRASTSAAAARHPAAPPAARRLPCGDALSFQVLLDRQGFSPGEIDAKRGGNFAHALAAFQATRNLPANGEPDCATWHALVGETSGPAVTTYLVTADDVKGPFEPRIPTDLAAQAALPQLAYRSALEQLAERFHMSAALLQQLNSRSPIAAGRSIQVPAAVPFDPGTKPTFDPAARGATVVVSREDSALRVTRADGQLIFFAPVTTGGHYDPLPVGDWKVTGVSWLPVFHYNPDLFWDAKPDDSKATIKPGPNNPVGVVWISLNLEHYGLHGSPEPGRIGQTESHGCVRLTNWDAARVASMVQPGTQVLFR